MNNKLFFTFIFGLSVLMSAQTKNKTDIWSGIYTVHLLKDGLDKALDTLIIEKTTDANPEDEAARYSIDLSRWTIVSKKDEKQYKKVIRRFLYTPEDNEDQYKEFRWTDLYKKGKMNCIDGGNFFICQTQPQTNVYLDQKEQFFSRTGIFGVWLHYGVTELKKIK